MLTPAVTSVALAQGDLHDALLRVRHAISKEETRYYLNGVYVHACDDRLHFVATDGHRLARVSLVVNADLTALVPVILPRDFIAAAIKATAKPSRGLLPATLELSPRKIMLRASGQGPINAAPIDGTFPDYQRLMPSGEPPHGTISIPCEQLQQACRAISAYSAIAEPDMPPVIRLSVGYGQGVGKLSLTRQVEPATFRFGRALEFAPASATIRDIGLPDTADGAPPPEIGFDARQLAELAQAAGDGVLKWHHYGDGFPALFEVRGDRAQFLLMPRRL